jgi:hypothetical protein
MQVSSPALIAAAPCDDLALDRMQSEECGPAERGEAPPRELQAEQAAEHGGGEVEREVREGEG